MKNLISVLFTLVTFVSLWLSTAIASEKESPAYQQLKHFQQLIGGTWHLQDSYQEFEWGLGKQSVTSRSYFRKDNQAQLVSEGFWYWHPAKNEIKGIFTAINMPFWLVEYTTVFEGNKMINDLLTYDNNGKQSSFIETWKFSDAEHYQWKLEQMSENKLKTIMGGTFKREIN